MKNGIILHMLPMLVDDALDAKHATPISTDKSHGVAVLSNCGGFSSFSFGDDVIRFATPLCLRRYLRVKKWDNGYLEVDADYGQGAEEDYIDLVPILKNLYYDVKSFLTPIQKVEVHYA